MRFSDLKHYFHIGKDRFNVFWGTLLFDKEKAQPELPVIVSSILFIRGDGKIGDGVVSSFIYRELKKSTCKFKIGVLCTKNTKHLYCDNQYIDEVHTFPKRAKMWEIKKLCFDIPRYDAVVFLGETLKPRDLKLLSTLNAKYNIGVANNVKLININIDKQTRGKHFQQYFTEVAKVISRPIEDFSYDFTIPAEIEVAMDSFLAKINKPYIAINPFGNTSSRRFTEDKLKKITQSLRVQYPEFSIILLSSPNTNNTILKIIEELKDENVYYYPSTKSIEESAVLIKYSALFISVDTATVHISNALQTPMVAIYQQGINNYNKWHPNYKLASSIFTRKPLSDVEEVNIGEFELPELFEKMDCLLKLCPSKKKE